MSALLCSSTSAPFKDSWRSLWRNIWGRHSSRHRRPTAPGVPEQRTPGPPADDLTPGEPTPGQHRLVVAVLTPGRAPERVVAEAVALAAAGSSPLRFLILRRAAGFSTDPALVAAVERSSDTAQRELLARAETLVSGPVSVDVLRIAGEDFDAPSRRLTARAVRAARRQGADVIVMPATLLNPTTATLTITIIAVDDKPAGVTVEQS